MALLPAPTTPNGWSSRGVALGTASPSTRRALQVDADAGADAGVALGLQVILTSLCERLPVPP